MSIDSLQGFPAVAKDSVLRVQTTNHQPNAMTDVHVGIVTIGMEEYPPRAVVKVDHHGREPSQKRGAQGEFRRRSRGNQPRPRVHRTGRSKVRTSTEIMSFLVRTSWWPRWTCLRRKGEARVHPEPVCAVGHIGALRDVGERAFERPRVLEAFMLIGIKVDGTLPRPTYGFRRFTVHDGHSVVEQVEAHGAGFDFNKVGNRGPDDIMVKPLREGSQFERTTRC